MLSCADLFSFRAVLHRKLSIPPRRASEPDSHPNSDTFPRSKTIAFDPDQSMPQHRDQHQHNQYLHPAEKPTAKHFPRTGTIEFVGTAPRRRNNGMVNDSPTFERSEPSYLFPFSRSKPRRCLSYPLCLSSRDPSLWSRHPSRPSSLLSLPPLDNHAHHRRPLDQTLWLRRFPYATRDRPLRRSLLFPPSRAEDQTHHDAPADAYLCLWEKRDGDA
jgi:hypothetical protein